MDAIRNYVKGAFQGVEPTAEVLEQQDEVVADLAAKVEDLVADGKSEDEALGIALASIGDLTVLASEFRAAQAARAAKPPEGPARRFPLWAKVVLAIVVVLAVLTLLSGAAGLALYMPYRNIISEVREKPHGRAEMLVEYREAAAKLTLPPGIVFPTKVAGGEAGAVYSKGCGTVSAQAYWRGAWAREWLDQRVKDPARAAAALHVLRDEAPRSEFMTTFSDDTTREFWARYLQQAGAGDPSGFQQFMDANPIPLVRAP
ncbi:MAG: permease prefix domain 1-containing protein [Coriobacteriia bacterium]|nr:permease prefix domain 1-containing protein [Coriobacteriia bacterium]